MIKLIQSGVAFGTCRAIRVQLRSLETVISFNPGSLHLDTLETEFYDPRGKESRALDHLFAALWNLAISLKRPFKISLEDQAIARGEKMAENAARPKADVQACSWLYRSMFVNWDGGILPCCDGTTNPGHDLGHWKQFAGKTRKEFEAFWNGDLYRNLRNMANFKVPREQMDKTYTCAICIKPHMPFVLYERGFELPAKIEKQLLATEPDLPEKRERWRETGETVSAGIGGTEE